MRLGFLFVTSLLMLSCGKTTLAPDGVYHGDKFLYETDVTLSDSKKSLGEYIDWTRANAAQIHAVNRDDVIHAAEKLRITAPLWFTNAWHMRSTYTNAVASHYSPETIASFSNSLWSIVNTISTEVRNVRASTNDLPQP